MTTAPEITHPSNAAAEALIQRLPPLDAMSTKMIYLAMANCYADGEIAALRRIMGVMAERETE